MAEESLSIADQNEDPILTLLYGDKINNVQFEVKDADGNLIDLNDAAVVDYGLRIKDFRGDGETVLKEYKASETDTGNVEITSPSTGIMQWYVDTASYPTELGHNIDRVIEFFWDDDSDGNEYLAIRTLRIKG